MDLCWLIGTLIYDLSSGFWYFPCISIQLLKKRTCFTTKMSVWNHFGIISIVLMSNVLFLLLAGSFYLATSHIPIFCFFLLLFYNGKKICFFLQGIYILLLTYQFLLLCLVFLQGIYILLVLIYGSLLVHFLYVILVYCFLLGVIKVAIEEVMYMSLHRSIDW